MREACRHLILFALSLTVGLWSAGFFESYVINFSVERTFTKQEADALIGKQVEQTFFDGAVVTGRIVGWKKDPDGHVRIQVKFDRYGKEKDLVIGYPKPGYENHLILK